MSFFGRIQALITDEQILPVFDDEKIEAKATKLQKEQEHNINKAMEVSKHFQVTLKELDSGLISGFDLASTTGPLMDEPIQGAVFIVEKLELDQELSQKLKVSENEDQEDSTQYGPIAGQVMSITKTLCKRAFLNADPRIVEGMYLCSMQASPETYGIVYNVINKSRGRVLKEDIQDGTNFFLIDALIPLIESFEFNKMLTKQTSGIAYPQLVFHGYEVNHRYDPLYIPKTIEEMEDHGEGDSIVDNIAKVLIEKVRTQKGMIVRKKILVDGEKQRTLTKNK